MTSEAPPLPTSPSDLLRWIQARFRELGIYGRKLTLIHLGHQYLVGCDDEAFTIYRRVDRCHLPPGAPGWPVCLVTADTAIDETSPPQLPEDDFASGLTLPEWLELMESLYGRD
jgi:hypothetical protein